MKPIIAIYGPTHTGKTNLAAEFFSRHPSEIISVDSVQIYREADIGSNKPDNLFLKENPHHLINILNPDETFSVGDFKEKSLNILKQIDSQSKFPILVGGTMMYFYSLIEGLAELPDRDELIRAELICDMETFGLESLYKRLELMDFEATKKIHPNDTQRIIRALEVCLITNEKFSEIRKKSVKEKILDRKILSFAIIPENKKEYKAQLEKRFEAMLEKGLLEEVEKIIDKYSKNVPLLKSVGYKECLDYLEKKINMKQLVEKAVNSTYKLSKRQITWLNKFTTTEIFEKNESNKVIKIESFI